MPRTARIAPAGYVQHVLNRANGRLKIFRTERDFLAFYDCLLLAHQRHPIRLLDWCVMNNHWHFVAWPRDDEQELSRFFGYLSLLHATRWQVAHDAVGTGHVYQARFKNFIVERDEHLAWLLRYVVRNALRAGIVTRAEEYRWTGTYARLHGPAPLRDLLTDWPIDVPRDLSRWLNHPQSDAEEAAIRRAIRRGTPLGNATWVKRLAASYNLASSLRPRGRPIGWRKSK
jgi:putative transposase